MLGRSISELSAPTSLYNRTETANYITAENGCDLHSWKEFQSLVIASSDRFFGWDYVLALCSGVACLVILGGHLLRPGTSMGSWQWAEIL